MNSKVINWFIFILLSLIWGSSFILMIKGMERLTPFQLAALRIIFSGIVLLPVALKKFKTIPKNKIFTIFLSGLLGSLIPAFLFCIAETKIDSSLVGSLNSLTPVFVLLVGVLFFSTKVSNMKILGIALSFIGSILLILSKNNEGKNFELLFLSFVILATILYGLNVNMVGKYLSGIPSLDIAAVALTTNAVPALIVLLFVKGKTGLTFFADDFLGREMLVACGYTFILGALGTAFASVIFYMLMKRAGIIFASMVTYAIPFVAVGWGIFYGETVGWKQIVCLLIILSGVYLANRVQRDDA
jgi:drug/metabolite transporter (DMT)-like permease